MRDVQLYYEAVNELLGDTVKEGIFVDEALNALDELAGTLTYDHDVGLRLELVGYFGDLSSFGT